MVFNTYITQCFFVLHSSDHIIFGHHFRHLFIPTFMVVTICLCPVFQPYFAYIVQLLLTFIVGHLQYISIQGCILGCIRGFTGHTMHFMDTPLFSNFIKWEFCKKKPLLQYSLKSCPMTKIGMSADQACKNTVKSLVLQKLANIFWLMYVVNVHQPTLAVICKSIKAFLDITSKETF